MHYATSLCLGIIGILLYMYTISGHGRKHYTAGELLYGKVIAVVVLLIGAVIGARILMANIDKHLRAERFEQCERVQQLFPDREVIFTDRCYVVIKRTGLYIVHGSVDTKLYTREEALKGND